MPGREIPRSLHVLLHLAAGGILALAASLVAASAEGPDAAPTAILALFGAGCVLLLVAALPPAHRLCRHTRFPSLLVVAAGGAVAALETGGRLARFDFDRQTDAQRRLPPFFRSPTVPMDPVFFRRTGPETWTGPVLRAGLEQTRQPTTSYESEAVVSVRYDGFGFRNPDGLEDWEVAVAGDSFVELGFLPDEDLFTARLARQSGRRVKNLGVSHTGPFTQLEFLRHYGLASATRVLVIVFYEGNDLYDLGWEVEALRAFRANGTREFRDLRPQTSFLRALTRAARTLGGPPAPRTNALARVGETLLPVTLNTRLVPELGLAPEARLALQTFLASLSELARRHQARPFLVFMPSKTRALEGSFRWRTPDEEQAAGVIPSRLPDEIRQLCREPQVGFVDLTPGLREAIRRTGRLHYNRITDTHLDAEGSRAVGDILAEALAPAWR